MNRVCGNRVSADLPEWGWVGRHICTYYINNYVYNLNIYVYTGQKKVALLDVEIHDNPIPLESYTMRQGKVWAVICHPGKPFIIINLKECDN